VEVFYDKLKFTAFSLPALLLVDLCVGHSKWFLFRSSCGQCCTEGFRCRCDTGFGGNSTYREIYYEGLTSQDLALCSRSNFWGSPSGDVILLDPKRGKIVNQIRVSNDVGWNDLHLSLDGRLLFGYQSLYTRRKFQHNPVNVIVSDANTLSRLTSASIGKGNHVIGFSLIPNRPDCIILGINSDLSTSRGVITVNERILVLNWKTRKILREIKYENGSGLLFSPDNKHFAGLYPRAEGEKGSVQFVDFRSGNIKLEVAETPPANRLDEQGPFFFLSPTQVVCSPTLVCDLKTQRLKSLFQRGDRRFKCVGGVGVCQRLCQASEGYIPLFPVENGDTRQDPARGLGFAFFTTKQGLELWNVPKNKVVRRWPNIKSADYVDTSPRLSMMAVHHGSIIEFWKFDPKWLR